LATTNRRLGGRKVSWLWVGGFKIVDGYAENAAVRIVDQNVNSPDNFERLQLSKILNDVRTYFETVY
jgi:hypothetical protein